MPSPFPGMNPYLERPSRWEDFHNSLIIAIRDAIAPVLMPRYFIDVQDNVYVRYEADDRPSRLGKPDLTVTTPASARSQPGTALMDAPEQTEINAESEEYRVPFLSIADAEENVVSIVEVLSPSNKALGDDRRKYIAKRNTILNSPVHLVEIDLLRGGPRMPARVIPQCDYLVTISRAESRPAAGYWPIGLRDPLPVFRLPLRPGDEEPVVDLQTLLHKIYDIAGYAGRIYRHEPVPPLRPEDAAWAQSLIALAAA